MDSRIDEINYQTNQEITYKKEKKDNWQNPLKTQQLKTGDCEDIAILKLYRLRESGYDGWIERCWFYLDGIPQAHAVVCIELAEKTWLFGRRKLQTFVLDNRESLILPKDHTEYIFFNNQDNIFTLEQVLKRCER